MSDVTPVDAQPSTPTEKQRFQEIKISRWRKLIDKITQGRKARTIAKVVTATQAAPDAHAALGSIAQEWQETNTESPEKKDVIRDPSPHLKVDYIIPIKGEVRNGNIFHQLRDFATQTCDTTDFEVIYVVNNTDQEATDKTDSFRENQELLSIFRYIAADSTDATVQLPEDLEIWQQRIVELAKKKRLNIHALDFSTVGLGDEVFDLIEMSRVSGENLAVDRFQQTDVGQENGAILKMDADTRINRDVTSQIIDQLVQKPDVGMLKILYDYIPGGEGGKKLFETTSQKRFSRNVNVFISLLMGSTAGNWYAIKAGALGHKNPLGASAYTQNTIMPTVGQVNFENGIRIYTQDRARSGKEGGHLGRNRLQELTYPEQVRDFKAVNPALSWLLRLSRQHTNPDIKNKIDSIIRTTIGDSPTLDIIIDQNIGYRDPASIIDRYPTLVAENEMDAVQYTESCLEIVKHFLAEQPNGVGQLQALIADEVYRERVRHAWLSGFVNRVLQRTTYSKNAGNISDDEISTYFSDNPNQQTSSLHFIRNNPWIVQELSNIRSHANNAVDAREIVNTEFPELLQPFNDTTYTRSNATMLGLIKFMEELRANPNRYPTATQFLTPPREPLF